MMNRSRERAALLVGPLALAIATTASACSSDGGSNAGGTGAVQIIVVPEESITGGIEPGTGDENMQDGWTVTYSRYLVAVGNFRARRSDTGDTLGDPTVYVLDLKNAPASGYVTKEFAGVAAVRWDKFGYDVANARPGAKGLPPTAQTDVDLMTSQGLSVYFEGTAAKGADTIAFKWGFRTGTSFDDCATSDGLAGFAVPAGGTVQIKPTLHGDHQYFDNVTQGVEITKRRAEWMKTCDKDGNKTLTLEELKQCDAAIALPTPPYDLAGVKDQDGDGKLTVFDYVSSQLRTFGDFQGDGECPTRAPLP